MVFTDFNPIGKTLNRISRKVGRNWGSKGLVVFLKQPEEPKTAPGKRIGEDFNLATLLFRYPELEGAKVVEHNDFYGESIFRVVLPRW